jgi:hypothetical protein
MWVLPNTTSGLLSVRNWKNTEFVGNVGIGTTFHATRKLDVLGDAVISGTTTVGTLRATTLSATTLSATNIGIGITNPTTSSIEIVRPVTTSTDLINMRYDVNNGLRLNQSFITVNDVKQIFIQKNNNIDSNALTFYKGNVGIGSTIPLSRLHIEYTSTALNPVTGVTGIYVFNPIYIWREMLTL